MNYFMLFLASCIFSLLCAWAPQQAHGAQETHAPDNTYQGPYAAYLTDDDANHPMVAHLAIGDHFFDKWGVNNSFPYLGLTLPVHCGYFTMQADGTVDFTLSSSLFLRIKTIFDEVKKHGGIEPNGILYPGYIPILFPGSSRFITTKQKYFLHALKTELEFQGIYIIKEFPLGEGLKYIPKFKYRFSYGHIPSITDREQFALADESVHEPMNIGKESPETLLTRLGLQEKEPGRNASKPMVIHLTFGRRYIEKYKGTDDILEELTLPHYCGYVIIDAHGVPEFVKRTDAPIHTIEEFFADMKRHKALRISLFGRYLHPWIATLPFDRVPYDHPYFFQIFMHELRYTLSLNEIKRFPFGEGLDYIPDISKEADSQFSFF